tara:strand:+ start:244 stop:414 length:171 start_codon:yes stop_codon:yes gene_type:complete
LQSSVSEQYLPALLAVLVQQHLSSLLPPLGLRLQFISGTVELERPKQVPLTPLMMP